MRYRDRDDAGRALGAAVAERLGEREDVIVLGIPRGGVPVARAVAEAVAGRVAVAVARKLGAPGQPELAIGAVTPDGPPVWNTGLMKRIGLDEDALESELQSQRAEAARRETLYRGDRPPADVEGKTAVIVDDGVATGATIVAVARQVRARGASTVVVAVPVGPRDTVAMLEGEADIVVCPHTPRHFRAVGEFYDDFRQLTDDEVLKALGPSS